METGNSRDKLYTSNGTATVQGICDAISDERIVLARLLIINNFNFYKYNREDCVAYYEYEELKRKGKNPKLSDYSDLTRLFILGITLKIKNKNTKFEFTPSDTVQEYLSFCNQYGLRVVKGLNILISTVNIPKMLTNLESLVRTYDFKKAGIVQNANAKYDFGDKGLLSTKKVTRDSYFVRVTPSGEKSYAPLPVIPQEFSDTNHAEFNAVSLMGRSVDYQIYAGSSRTVSFTLQLHQEIFPTGYKDTYNNNNIYRIVALIESCNYPWYEDGYAGPPQIIFKIGNQFYIQGILESCQATWKAPINSAGNYMNCDLSISVRETTGPWGADDIYKGTITHRGGWRE